MPRQRLDYVYRVTLFDGRGAQYFSTPEAAQNYYIKVRTSKDAGPPEYVERPQGARVRNAAMDVDKEHLSEDIEKFDEVTETMKELKEDDTKELAKAAGGEVPMQFDQERIDFLQHVGQTYDASDELWRKIWSAKAGQQFTLPSELLVELHSLVGEVTEVLDMNDPKFELAATLQDDLTTAVQDLEAGGAPIQTTPDMPAEPKELELDPNFDIRNLPGANKYDASDKQDELLDQLNVALESGDQAQIDNLKSQLSEWSPRVAALCLNIIKAAMLKRAGLQVGEPFSLNDPLKAFVDSPLKEVQSKSVELPQGTQGMVTSITYTPDIGLKVVRFNVDSVQNIDGYEAKGFMASEESVLKATGVDVPSPAGPDISVDEDAPEFPADVVQMHPQEQEAAVNKLLEQYEGASPERRQQLSEQIRSIQSALNSMLWQKVGGYDKHDKFHTDLLVQSMKEDDDFVTCDVEEHRVLEALLNKEWKNG